MNTIWTKTAAVLALVLVVAISACRTNSIEGTLNVVENKQMQELRESRDRMIEHLEVYAEAGEFPQDPEGSVVYEYDPHYRNGKNTKHRLIGSDGAHCALAYIMAQTGEAELIRTMSEDHNDFCVGLDLDRDVDENFMQWILASGLTLEECILIQKPAEDAVPVDQHQKEIRIHIARVIKRLRQQTFASLRVVLERLSRKKG